MTSRSTPTRVPESTLHEAALQVDRSGSGFTFTYAETLALIAEVRAARRRDEKTIDDTSRTNQVAFDEIQRILGGLPDEASRKVVLEALLVDRCRQCLDYDPNATRTGRWCCYDSRGG